MIIIELPGLKNRQKLSPKICKKIEVLLETNLELHHRRVLDCGLDLYTYSISAETLVLH